MTGTDVRLSDEQVDLVHRLQHGKFGDVNFDEYEVPQTQTTFFGLRLQSSHFKSSA